MSLLAAYGAYPVANNDKKNTIKMELLLSTEEPKAQTIW